LIKQCNLKKSQEKKYRERLSENPDDKDALNVIAFLNNFFNK